MVVESHESKNDEQDLSVQDKDIVAKQEEPMHTKHIEEKKDEHKVDHELHSSGSKNHQSPERRDSFSSRRSASYHEDKRRSSITEVAGFPLRLNATPDV